MVNSLLTAIVRADGDALVMHVGERPYVVASSGPVELSSRPLTLDAVTGMLGQLLPFDARRALEELGAIEHELPGSTASHGDRFTVVAARGGDDIWIEVRRHRKPQPVVVPAQPAPIAAVDEPTPAVVVPADVPVAPVEETPAIAEAAAATIERPPAAPVEAPTTAPVEEPRLALPEEALRVTPPEVPAVAEERPAGAAGEALQVAAEPMPVEIPVALEPPAPVVEAPVPPAPLVPEPPAAGEPVAAAEPVVVEGPVAVQEPPVVEQPAVVPEPVAIAEPERVSAAQPEAFGVEEPFAEPAPAHPLAAEPTALEQPVIAAEPDVVEPVAAAEPAAAEHPAAIEEPKVLQERQAPVTKEPVVAPTPPVAVPVAAPASRATLTAPTAPPPAAAVTVEPPPVAPPVAAAPVVPPEPAVMSFEELVDASLRAAALSAPPPPAPAPRPTPPAPAPSVGPKAPESVVRPLAAAPIVERPPVDSRLVDEPVYQAPARDAAPVSPRPIAAVQPEPAPAVVLPLARNPVRMEPQSRTLPSPRIAGIDRLLRLSAARGGNTLYLMAQARPSVRVDGEIAVLEGEPVLSAHEVESLLLDLAPERSREALEAGEGTEWMSEVPEVGRIRCQSFRDHRGPGGIFRIISNRPTSAEQLGLAREIQALCAEPEGLILVAGPRASGKSTLVSSLVDLINRTRNDYVITVESQIQFVHESRSCLVSQREVRGRNEDLAVVVRAALRENPDVLVIEDMRSPEVVRLALEAMEAGHLVIGAVSAHGAATAVGKMLDQSPEERRSQMRLALAEGLRGVVSQVLLRKNSGGRVAAREVLLNMPSIANLIAEGRVSQLPLAIDSGRKHGMVPLNDALAAFVQSGVVDVKEAYRKAFERQAFLAVLRREGVDTSFVERLA